MHLVDLAGSERVSKTRVLGTILSEAKHINLSLHFLEQVIICLQVSRCLAERDVKARNAIQWNFSSYHASPTSRMLKRCVSHVKDKM